LSEETVSWTGAIENLNGHLVVFIPLELGGAQLARITRGLGDVEDGRLKITIPTWLAEELSVREGTVVTVDNKGGTLHIHREGT
jgi:hypothetical protein